MLHVYVTTIQDKQQQNFKKKVVKTGKKRRQATSDTQTDKPHKTKSKKKSSGDSTTTRKTKRKRTKNEGNRSLAHHDNKDVEAMMEFSSESYDVDVSDRMSERLEVTAVQLSGKSKVGVIHEGGTTVGRLSRAEQRRIEIERKRAEKRALELEKKHEEEERMRLQVCVCVGGREILIE